MNQKAEEKEIYDSDSQPFSPEKLFEKSRQGLS
jgi:hypothetical protein